MFQTECQSCLELYDFYLDECPNCANALIIDRIDLQALKQYLDRHICHMEPDVPEHVKALQQRVADILNDAEG